MKIDIDTGELYEYEVTPYSHKEGYTDVKYLEDVRSVDDMEDFMKSMVDRRKIRGSNTDDLLRFFESCLGYKVLKHSVFGDTSGMSVPQYKLLDRLGKLVEYKNVIMITRHELCQHLDCKDNNLMKKLNTVGGYLKIYTQEDGIRKGEIKILINPKFFYVFEYSLYDLSRDMCIEDWCKGFLREQGCL